jgi:hypothetical protein
MPALKTPRYEDLARGVARGMSLRGAARAYGYGKPSDSTYKYARTQTFRVRVEEFRRRLGWGDSPDLAPVIDELMGAALEAKALGSAAGMKAACDLWAKAADLKRLLPPPPESEEPMEPPMTTEEWVRKYKPSS